MPRIAKCLLIAHQHVHVKTSRGIGASKLATGSLRLVTDHFARVINLAPVRQPGLGELNSQIEDLPTYPNNVECKVLYQHSPARHIAVSALRHFGSIPTIWREVRNADVVYARMPCYPALISSLLGLFAGKELMLSLHSDWGHILLVRRGDRPWFRTMARLADAYQKSLAQRSVVTLVTGDHLRRLGGTNAVTISQHQFTGADLYRRQDTCQKKPIRLLLVGILSKRKGLDFLLDAMLELDASNIDCTLTLVGPPSDYNARREISRRKLDQRVTLTGHVAWGTQLFELYRSSDLFVFPSLSEGSPKAPMEALSQSLPVIATPSGSSDYIENEVTRLLIPPGDTRALVRAIQRMIEDGELRRRCMARGLEVAEQNSREWMARRIGRALDAAFN